MPSLLLVSGQAGAEVETEVLAWGADNGYHVYQVDPEADIESRLAEGNLQIVVSIDSDLGMDLAFEAGPWKYLAVHEDQTRPSEFVSVISSAGTRYEEVGFLAGITAGLGHQTGVVGILVDGADPSAESFALGFNQGVKFSCPRCKVVSQMLDSWENRVFAREAIRMVFAPLPTSANETLNELANLGYWLILSGSTPENLPAEQVAGVVSFETATLVRNALDGLHAGEQGKAWAYTAQNGGLELGQLNPLLISPGREQWLLEIQHQLQAGALELGQNY